MRYITVSSAPDTTTAIVPVREASLATTTGYHALEARIAKYNIPQEEVKLIQDKLKIAQEEDAKDHQTDVNTAVEKYVKETPKLARAILFFKRGFKTYRKAYTPTAEPEKSELTKYLEDIVKVQGTILEGYKTFSELPEHFAEVNSDYAELKKRQTQLEIQLKDRESAIEEVPRVIQRYESVISGLKDYAMLKDEEKEMLAVEIQAMQGVSEHPPLDIPSVRKRLMDSCEARIAEKQLSMMNYTASVELDRQELDSAIGQQKILEEMVSEFEQSCFPTLKRLNEHYLTYAASTKFVASAKYVIGMNLLRERMLSEDIDLKADMVQVKNKMLESRLCAEAAEAGEEDVREAFGLASHKDEEAQEEIVEIPAVERIEVHRR